MRDEKYKSFTAHQLAQRLLAGPDLPVEFNIFCTASDGIDTGICTDALFVDEVFTKDDEGGPDIQTIEIFGWSESEFDVVDDQEQMD